MNLLGSLDFKEMLRKRDTQITIGLIAALLIGSGIFYSYRWYNNKIQRSAQKDFSESFEVFQQALYMEDQKNEKIKVKENIWDEVELAFKTGCSKNKSSSLAPFFLAFAAQAEIKLGKLEDAFKNLNDALAKLSNKSPYYNLYKIKIALLNFDIKKEQDGIALLDELIKDKNNIYRDMAAFYLGEYFWSINNLEKAKEQFIFAESFNPKSPWAMLSKLRLKKLS